MSGSDVREDETELSALKKIKTREEQHVATERS